MGKRRANGEGSIFKRKDGLWAAQYTDNTGKKRVLYGKTQQIAKDKLKEAIRQSEMGISMDKNKILFIEWLKEWLEVYIKPTTRPKTYALYYGNIYNHIIPAFPKVLLKDLRADMIQKFLNEKAVSGRLDGKPGGLSISVLKDMRKVITGALNQAVDNNIIPFNVALRVRLPKETHKEKEILTKEQQQRLESVALMDDNPLSFSVLLSLYTGLRIGEIKGLKLDDIDLKKKELYVRRSVSRVMIPEKGKTEVIVSEPKTAKGKRTIPLPDFLVELLTDYIDKRNRMVEGIQGYWRGKTAEEAALWKDEGYLFITLFGTVPDHAAIRRIFERLLKEADIPKVTFHALRHTFATRCIEAGFDVKSLSEILGHTDAKMTLNTYTHALEEQKRGNMEKLNDVFTRDEIGEE